MKGNSIDSDLLILILIMLIVINFNLESLGFMILLHLIIQVHLLIFLNRVSLFFICQQILCINLGFFCKEMKLAGDRKDKLSLVQQSILSERNIKIEDFLLADPVLKAFCSNYE